MKKLIFIFPLLLIGCRSIKTVYVPVESVKVITTTVHDTLVQLKLDVLHDSIVTKDTLSVLSNKYAYSSAMWSNGMLSHSLSIKDVQIPIRVQYINTNTVDSVQVPYSVETIKEVNFLTDWQRFRLLVLDWLFIALALYGLWRFRKPLRKLIFKV